MGLIKGILYNLANDAEQNVAVQEGAEYLDQQIEAAEEANANAGIAMVAEDEGETGIDFDQLTFMDILWDIILGVSFEISQADGSKTKIALSDIINDQLFITLASCAWYDQDGNGSVEIRVPQYDTDELDNSTSEIATKANTDYYVDRETVLLTVLETIVFQPGVRDLLAIFISGLDFSDEYLKTLEVTDENGKLDTNALLSALLYGVFEDPQAIEALLINLLSWYNIVYEDARVVAADSTYEEIDWNAAGISEAELENLPVQLDSLITAILPLVGELLPALGVNLELNLQGNTVEEVVENLLTSLFIDTENADGTTKNGLATTIFTALINLFGKGKLDSILSMVYELTGGAEGGVNLQLSYFKEQSTAIAEIFDGLDTWEAAYEAFKVEVVAEETETTEPAEGETEGEATEDETTEAPATEYVVVIPDADSFGITTYDDVMALLEALVVPFVPVLKLLMVEDGDLVLLDGITISAGDGYDRFIIPVAEMLGIEIQKDKNEVAAIATDKEFAHFVIEGIQKLLNVILEAPVQTIIDLLPELSFFITSNGLAQAVEQVLAPVLTLVDMVNEVTAAEMVIEGRDEPLVALNVYEFLADLLSGILTLPEGTDTVEEIVTALLTEEGLINLIKGLVKDKDLSFLDGIFSRIVAETVAIGNVETARYFGATTIGDKRYVKGVSAERANTIVKIISEIVLADDGLIFDILEVVGVDLADEKNATIKTVIDGITGDNRYCILQVLLNYFNHYDVENIALEYLSFEKLDYSYETYSVDSNLTARKVRRAIKKLDQAILAVIPDLLPMLEEVELLKGALDSVKGDDGYTGVTLAMVVEALLTDLAFNNQMMNTIVGAVINAIGGLDILDTILPLLDELLDINFTPAGVVAKSENATLDAVIGDAIAATDLTVEGSDTPRAATWADIKAYYTTGEGEEAKFELNVDWGLDAEGMSFDDKKDLFIDIIWAFIAELEPVLNFLLRGEDIAITSTVDGNTQTVLEIKGGEGYEYALAPLFQALAVDQYGTITSAAAYEAGKGTDLTLTAITDSVFTVVDALCEGPVEYILTLVPSLAYFIESNGVELLVENLLSPVFALLEVAEPAVGDLLNDLLGGLLGNALGKFMPANVGTEVTNEDGTTSKTYTLDEIVANIGTSENLVNIINNLVGGLLVKTEEGETVEPIQLLPANFFEEYVQYAVDFGTDGINKDKTYFDLKVIADGGEFGGVTGQTISVASDKYDASIHSAHYELTGYVRNVVTQFNVDIADSFVYLLDNVLSEELLNALLPADKRVDDNGEQNLVGMIIENLIALINGDIAGLTVTDILVSLFEGYEITYADFSNIYIEIDHSNDVAAAELPGKLDTIINEALPLVLTLLVTGEQEEGSLLDIILDTVKAEVPADSTVIEEVVDALLNGFLCKDSSLMNTIVNALVGVLGGTAIIDTVLGMIKIGDNLLTAEGFKASINTHFAGKADYADAVAAVNAIIGDAETWADVLANAPKGEDGKPAFETDWGIEDLDSFIAAIMVLAQPLTPVLQVLFQGKTLTLLDSNGIYTGDFETVYNTTTGTGETPDDDRAEEIASGVILGDGFIEIRGSKGYEEAILALAEALCIEDVVDPATYNSYTAIEDILGTILDLVLGIVNGIAEGPVEYISEHLAGLLYFVVSDNLKVLVNNVLGLAWGLLEVVEPITGQKDAFIQKLLGIDLNSYVSLEGLLGLINGLLEGKVDLVITQELLEKLIAEIGEYTIITSYREGTNTALKDGDNLVDIDGNTATNEDGTLKDTIETNKIATITGSKTYFVNGLLTFAVEEVLPIFADEENADAIINQVITYLSADGAVEGVIDFLNKLTTKYVVDFFAIEEPEVALQKFAIAYASELGHTVTKAETQTALANLDALVAKLLPMLGVIEDGETLADFVSGLLLNDDMLNTIVGLLAGIFGGLNQDILDIIEIVAGALGEEIDITVATYKTDADIAGFFGEATTWAEVIAMYTPEGADTATYDYAWGLDAMTDVNAKIETFVAVLTSFLAPLDFVLEVLLAGGTATGNAEDADAISAFKEINIMGGSGYNYAIIPLMEALGVPADMIKNQTEYEATFATQGTLGYILETVLKYVVDGLDAPVDFVLSLIANLAYTISKDGLTTIVGNLIAPVSALIKSIEGVLPVAIVIDLNGIFDETKEILNFKMGDDVAKAGYNVGLTLDLNGTTLEDLIDTVIAKYLSDLGLNINISFREIAAGAAATDADGNIIYTDSKVNSDLAGQTPAVWDKLNGTWGKNISGDTADTIITLLDMLLTKDNINAILTLVLKDKTLEETLDGILAVSYTHLTLPTMAVV